MSARREVLRRIPDLWWMMGRLMEKMKNGFGYETFVPSVMFHNKE